MFKSIIVALVIGLSISCASVPTTVTTPAGQYAFKANQAISALSVFQDAAISANSQKLISDKDTGYIVTFVKSTTTTIEAGTAGWKVAVQTGLTQLGKDLSPAANTKYGTYLTLISNIIASI